MAESDKNSDEKSTFETENNEELTYSDFNGLTAYDSTCELVAYVEGIDGPKIVGTNRLMIFKIFLANDNGEKLQLIAWNDEVRMIEPKISVNNILHLDGVYVKPSQRGKYNSGSEDYELVVQSNSKINVLGRRESKEEEKKAEVEEIVLPLSTFHDLRSLSCRDVRVQGYLKSEIGLLKTKEGRNDMLIGSITDGDYKLEIRLPGIVGSLELAKCSHVEVTGLLQSFANPLHILIRHPDDIKLVDDDKMPFVKMLKVTKSLTKVSSTPTE